MKRNLWGYLPIACIVFFSLVMFGTGCAQLHDFLWGADGPGGDPGPGEKITADAAAAGIPWAGVANIGIGILGSIYGLFSGYKRKAAGKDMVKMLDELKAQVKDLNTDEDVERVILAYSKRKPSFGQWLFKLHKKIKGG